MFFFYILTPFTAHSQPAANRPVRYCKKLSKGGPCDRVSQRELWEEERGRGAAWLAEVSPLSQQDQGWHWCMTLLLSAAPKLGLISIKADQSGRTIHGSKNLKRTRSLQADLVTANGV